MCPHYIGLIIYNSFNAMVMSASPIAECLGLLFLALFVSNMILVQLDLFRAISTCIIAMSPWEHMVFPPPMPRCAMVIH